MAIRWNYKNNNDIFITYEQGGVPFLSFKALEYTRMVMNGFSTHLGGASKGKFAIMNFSYSRKDDPSHVLENFTRMADALEVERDRMVVSYQTHTVNVRRVTEGDEGKDVIRERGYRDVDGLITSIPGITLVTFYADCVPLYLVGTRNRAIGLSHPGRRGTIKGMGRVTIDAMKEAYGTRAEGLVVCIDPSICRECFGVGEEVVAEFKAAFSKTHRQGLFCFNGKPGKYQIDLWRANEIVFREAGVPKEQIHTTNICTVCNNDYLFSHRRVGEERGNLAAFLCLR